MLQLPCLLQTSQANSSCSQRSGFQSSTLKATLSSLARSAHLHSQHLLWQAFRERDSTSTKWRSKHNKVRQEKGIASDAVSWTAQHHVVGIGPLAARVRDAIDLCVQVHMASCDSPPESLIVDVSQDGSRNCCGTSFRSMTRGSTYFVLSASRLVTAREHLNLLGFPKMQVGHLSETAIRDLTGDGMAVPCVATALLLVAHELPVWTIE